MKNAAITELSFSIDFDILEVTITDDPEEIAAIFIESVHGWCDNTCEVCHITHSGYPLAALALEYRKGEYSDCIDDLMEAVQTHRSASEFHLEHWLSEYSDTAASQEYFECPECSEYLYGQDHEEYECDACGFVYERSWCVECDSPYNAVGTGGDNRCLVCGYKPSEHSEHV